MKNFIFVVLFLPLFVFAKGYGIITLLKGSSQVKNSQGQLTDLKRGDKIYESDTVITSAQSIVRIVMMDTNIIDVYPNSKLLIKEYVFNPKEDQKNVRLEVSEGQIKSTVKQKYDNDKNKYNVKTPVIVAGVRGTIFTTSHEAKTGESRIMTHEGNVMVGKLDANEHVKEFFSVKANQTLQVDQKTTKPEVKDMPKIDVERQKDKDQKEGFVAINSPVNSSSANSANTNSSSPNKEIDKNDKKEEKPPRLEDKSAKSDDKSASSDERAAKKEDKKESDRNKNKNNLPTENRPSLDDKNSEITDEQRKKHIQDDYQKKHDEVDREKKRIENPLPVIRPPGTTPSTTPLPNNGVPIPPATGVI